MDKTLARRRLAHLITNFQRCRHQPQCTCERVAGYCVLHAVVYDGGPLFRQAFLMRATRSARVSTLVRYTSPVSHPHKQKSKGFRAGWSVSSFCHISVTVQNRTHVHMNFFCLESYILLFPKVLQIPPESLCIRPTLPMHFSDLPFVLQSMPVPLLSFCHG